MLLFPLALRRGHWPSAVYALWDAIFSVGLYLGLLTRFRRGFDRPDRLGRFLAQQSYAVYVVHIPIIVLLALALRSLHPEQLLKFGLAAVIGVPLCFAVAAHVRRLPLSATVL